MADANKFKEEKIKDLICDDLIRRLTPNTPSTNIATAKSLADIYETLFGKYLSGKPDETIKVEGDTKS
jgi:hypothetical protein